MRILALSTWFPYPLDQGSKIRAYHLLKGLAQRHELALVSFEDKPSQPAWMEAMRQFCDRIEIVRRQPFDFSRQGIVRGWFSWRPSAVVAGYSPEMSNCAQQVAREWRPDLVLAITFVTAPYAMEMKGLPRVIDVDNLLSDMLYEAYQAEQHPLRRVRRYLAYWKMRQYEKQLFRAFDLGLIVSRRDEQRAQEHLGAPKSHVGLVPNGVDLEYYRPGCAAVIDHKLIYNGALTYYPNFNAVKYFLSEIFPQVLAQSPQARLYITGNTGNAPVDELPHRKQVTFTGYLDDIRPAVASSRACVVPLQQGAGTRLKILEALALGTPVVSTSKGAEGLEFEAGRHLVVADHPADFARWTVRLLNEPELRAEFAEQGRRLVEEKYDWRQIGAQFCQLVEETRERTRKRGANVL